MNALHADRRWCLTGTPIQNRLDDLGALVRFLKIEPFDGKSSKAQFNRYVTDPLFSDDEDPFRNLRILLRSICLRRTKQSQSNLTAKYETVTLSLSTEERLQYDQILEQAKMDMDMLVSTSSPIQKYSKLFTFILRLRMFCDIGLFGKDNKSSPYTWDMLRTPTPTDFQSNLICELCQTKESLDLMKGLSFCTACSRPLMGSDVEASDMMEQLQPAMSLTPQAVEVGNAPNDSFRSPNSSPQPFLGTRVPAEPYSTKLSAVAQNLRDSMSHSKRFETRLL